MRNPSPRIHKTNPYRSQLCILFQRGKCYKGENCYYAHCVSDLRNIGFANVGSERRQIQNEDTNRNGAYKSKLCFWSFSGKHCPYGERCHFLHKHEHVGVRNESLQRESLPISATTVGKDENGSEQYRVLTSDGDQRSAWFYKTMRCAKWESFGWCPYGVKCTYAHGETELETHTKKLYLLESETHTKKHQVKSHSWVSWSVEKIGRIYGDWIDSTDELQSPSS